MSIEKTNCVCDCKEFEKYDPAESLPKERLTREHLIRHGPIQPKEFPQSTKVSTGRSFRSEWFKVFPWLEYSIKSNLAFCFYCRWFAKPFPGVNGGQVSKAFTETGFNNWKKAMEKSSGFMQHAESKTHVEACYAYQNFVSRKSVDTMLSEEKEKSLTQQKMDVQKNRTVLSRIFDVTRFLAKLGLPFRGHDEQSVSLNRGVFLEFIDILAANGDTVLDTHLKTCPANATYLSPQIQNEMISTLGQSIQEMISQSVKKASVYAVLMDETTDVSRKEQVAIFVRYVENFQIKERFLALIETDDVTGAGLTDLLLQTLKTHDLNVSSIVGQGYDGGSNMSSAVKGVQNRIRELNPSALFTHCYCHNLNRALINAVCSKDNRMARDFFGIVEQLYVCVEGSPLRHSYFLERQMEICQTQLHLKGLSETRWNCRAASLERLRNPGILQAVVDTLEHIADTTTDGQSRGSAVGLVTALRRFSFILSLCVLSPVMSVLNDVSEHLQKPDLDILQASQLVSCLKQEYSRMRCDTTWQSSILEAQKLAEALNIPSEFQESRKRKVPRRFEEGQNEGVSLSAEEDLKVNFFYNLLDRLIGELRNRFPSELSDVAFLQPSNMHAIDAEQRVKRFAARFPQVDSQRVLSQWRLIRHNNKDKTNFSLMEVFRSIPSDFEDLCTIYQIAMTLPVTTASVERGFSKLSLVKTKLRSTMNQERLEALVIANVEKDLLMTLSVDDLVTKFTANTNRRLDFL